MVRLKRILEDAEVIFDNPDARVPLALVSMEDFELIAQMIIEEVHQVIVVGGVDDLDGVPVSYTHLTLPTKRIV